MFSASNIDSWLFGLAASFALDDSIGIQIFWDDHDRDDFVDRLAGLVKDGALTVYAVR